MKVVIVRSPKVIRYLLSKIFSVELKDKGSGKS